MQKNKLVILISFLIICVSRIIYISQFPPSLNWDEVSLGYNSYSVLKTGKDEWGVVLPTIFRAFGDYKLPVYIYSLTPAIAIWGLNEFTVRLPSIISGLCSLIVIYILARKIFPQKKYFAWLALITYAFSPWSWFLSRIALEANVALAFTLLGIACLLFRRFSSSALLLGLSVWTYNANRIFIPLLILFYFYKNFSDIPRKSLTIIVLILGLMFLQIATATGQARFRWTTILDEGAIAKINEQSLEFGGRILHNKGTYILVEFTKNYISHFTPNFLFIKGGNQYQFSVQNIGVLNIAALPFFYFGLIRLIRYKSKYKYLLLVWVFLSPIPASITRDAPHVLRSLALLPVSIFISIIGLDIIIKKYNKIIYFYVLILVIFTSVYINKLQTYRTKYSWAWQFGYKQLAEKIFFEYQNFDQIIITKRYGEPHEFILFYTQYDPEKFQSDENLNRYSKSDWFWVDGFDKFRFVNDWEISALVANLPHDKKYLIVSSPESPTIGSGMSNIEFLDGSTAFNLKQL